MTKFSDKRRNAPVSAQTRHARIQTAADALKHRLRNVAPNTPAETEAYDFMTRGGVRYVHNMARLSHQTFERGRVVLELTALLTRLRFENADPVIIKELQSEIHDLWRRDWSNND